MFYRKQQTVLTNNITSDAINLSKTRSLPGLENLRIDCMNSYYNMKYILLH